MADVITIADAIQVASLVAFLAVVGWLAVRFRATPTPSAAAELEGRIWQRAVEQGARLQSEIDALRREIVGIRRENDELRAWVVDLTQQVISLGATPAPRPHMYPAIVMMDGLYDLLRTRFTVLELETLSHDAGLQWEQSGAAGLPQPAAALHLYEYAERMGRLSQLGDAAHKARPGVAA